MTAVAVPTLSEDEARSLTDEVRQDGERLWRKLAELYHGNAHVVLGYSSWHGYCEAEFGFKQAQAYRMLQAGQVNAIIPRDNGSPPLSERQARELAPLRNDPERMRRAWAEASANGEPTAQQIREVVDHHRRDLSPAERTRATARDVTLSVADAIRYLDRPPSHAAEVAAMFDPANAGIEREDWTPQRFKRAERFLSELIQALTNRTEGT